MKYEFTYRFVCWEIMKFNNLNCPAKNEPETPCKEGLFIEVKEGQFIDVLVMQNNGGQP